MGYMTAGRRVAGGRSYTVCTALAVTQANNGNVLKTMEFADAATARLTFTTLNLDADPGATLTLEVETAPVSTDAALWATVDPGEWIGSSGTVGETNGTFYAAFAPCHRFVRVKLVAAGGDVAGTITVKAEAV